MPSMAFQPSVVVVNTTWSDTELVGFVSRNSFSQDARPSQRAKRSDILILISGRLEVYTETGSNNACRRIGVGVLAIVVLVDQHTPALS